MRESHELALAAAMRWVESAHEAVGGDGVSAGYDLNQGWLPTYPETSGYLIPTMLRAACILKQPELAATAARIGDWLLGVQHADGAFPGGTGTKGDPVIFDVGQILLGLTALWQETGEERLLASAVRAGDWLCAAQEESGAWRSHLGYPNTYSSRVTWAVAQLWSVTGDQALLDCAHRSLDWILDRVGPDGWIDRMAFSAEHTPWTHTIGYALRGLLRSADLVGGERGERCVRAAEECALRIAGLETDLLPLVPGEIGPGYAANAGYACLTGDAQMAIVWLDLADRRGDEALRRRCVDMVDRLVQLQVSQPLEPAAVGAIPGSWPLTGGFEPLAFPAWSVKFFADAILELGEREDRVW